MSLEATRLRIEELAERNRVIHESECLNLNPATNMMSARAEALLSAGLGTRPSLGDPGDKYEMGLEAIEEIELIAADLARQVFRATHAEIRVPSGAMGNLFSFMAVCEPGDAIIVPPPTIGGHVTHQRPGAAGLYRLDIHEAPVDASRYSIDVDELAELARRVRPKLITIGQSLNLLPHPVAEIRAIADEVGARVLFDAAHVCGLLAGGVWSNPLDEGADLVSMSTYKSLGGPPGGLLVTNDSSLAEKLAAIAYPGLTANFDVAKSAALAMTLTDWLETGPTRAQAMVDTAIALAVKLVEHGLPVFETAEGPTTTHQFAVRADQFGGGHQAALHLRRANLLTCAIGLPDDSTAGLRFGTPELTQIGMGVEAMNDVADLVASAWNATDERELVEIGARTTALRQSVGSST